MHLTHLGGVFLPVLSGRRRTGHSHLPSSPCPHLSPLSSMVPSFRPPTPLAVFPGPKSAATTPPDTPTLASSILTDGCGKSGWVPKMLLDFCSPFVPRPYGATRREGQRVRHLLPTPPPPPYFLWAPFSWYFIKSFVAK